MSRKSSLAALALAGSALAPLAAQAQAASQPPAAPAPSAATAVNEVVVTAQKRSESLVNVPIAVTAVSGSNLQKSGVADMGDLAHVVPGLHVDSSGAFFQPSIRGVGTAIAGAGASANIATYVDGVYRPNALSNDFEFIDIDSVQVLKGPQGTLFGRNSTGGAIVVTTKAPSFDPQLEARAGYGSFNTFTASVYGSDRITDKLAASLSIGGSRSDGWVKNILTGKSANQSQSVAGRLKLLYEPTDKTKFTLIFTGFRTDDPSLYAASAYKGESVAALFGVPLSVGNPRQVSLSGPVAHVAQGYGVELKSEVDLGFATLTSYTAGNWDKGREATNELAAAFPADGSLPLSPATQTAVENADWRYTERTFSQEFDLSHSGGGPIDWVAGLFYYYDKTTYNPFNLGLYGPFGPGGVLTGASPDPVTHLFPAGAYVSTGDQALSGFSGLSYSGAVFADATYNLGNWHFTLGGRYSIDRAGADFTSYPSIANGFFGATGLSARKNFHAFTPRVIVRYSLTPNSNIYVSYSEGTKSGLYNTSGFLSQNTPLQPEKIKDVEGGYKVSGHGWRLEISAFHYDYTNLQVATYVGGLSFLQNAPSAELYGADVHWQQRLGDHFQVDVGAAYTHARYTNFTNAALQTFSPVFGVVNGTTDVSGGVMTRTPEFSASVALDYNTDLLGGTLALNATGSYQTQSSFDFANTLKDDAHGLLNLRAAWTDPSHRWTFAVIGRNVTNKVYLVQVLPNAGGFGAVYGEPANVTLQVQYKY
ncbi:MAG TPA: TonB-dependent receptor [Caulobacteraceae bacterium]